MKKALLHTLATITFSIATHSSFGQGMPAQAARVVASQHMQFQMHQQMQMLHLMSMNQNSATLFNPSARYKIVMKDSTIHELNSKIRFDEKKNSYLEMVNKEVKRNDPNRIQRIYPSDTHSITRLFSDIKSSVPGMPADSCWLFKSVKGKINGYTFLPLPEASQDITIGYFKFFQKEDGPLQRLQNDTLLAMMQGHEKATKFLKKGDQYKALLEYNKPLKASN